MLLKSCEFCGKQFSFFPCRKDSARFCSLSCRSKGVGAHQWPSVRAKISETMKRKTTLPKWIAKNGAWNRGLKGVMKSNQTSFKVGQRFTEELKAKRLKNFRRAVCGRPRPDSALLHTGQKYNLGKKWSQETKEKMRIAAITRMKNMEFLYTKPNVYTDIERLLEIYLLNCGCIKDRDFFHNKRVSSDSFFCFPDFVFPKEKIALFADGWVHDVKEKVKLRDKLVNSKLPELGWKVIRLSGKQIKENNFSQLRYLEANSALHSFRN